MYSVVLATMMTVTPSTPDLFLHGGWHGCHGCHGYVNAFSYGGCYGCAGCWGCYGYTCHGCYGGWAYSCHGCYGWSCHGCYGYTWQPAPACCGGGVIVVRPADPEKKLPKPKEEKFDGSGKILIKAPADVRLTVDGQPLVLDRTSQSFETPALEKGRTYSYVFKAEAMRNGRLVTREEKVLVRAGEASQVDFSDLAARAAARVTVVLPSDARLIVEDVVYPEGTGKRTFDTPELEAGKKYSYTMRAEVMRDGRLHKEERRVSVESGKDVVVEFKELPVLQAALR